jgi:RHS repeat-associated protein
MTPMRSLSSRVLVAVLLAVATSAAVVPALDAPQPAPANVTAVVVDHWPPHDDDLYGPHFITARPDSQVWYEDFFSTRLVSGAKYYLKVNNPAPGGPGAVSNFSVMLNGVYVADPGMMGGQPELVKEVPLQAWNALEVWTPPGTGQLRVMITIVPMTHIAPAWAERVQPAGQINVTKTWQVTVPADAGGDRVMVVDNGDYDRTGRIGEQEWGEIKINGVRAVWLDTLHLEQSKLVVPVTLPTGTSTIEAFLGNAVPGVHINVRVMYADTAKPKLVVTAPANNTVVGTTSVTVSGTYEDPMWGSVNVGTAQSYQSVWLGHMAGVQPWSVSHPLNEGPNTIKIWARDGAGNTSDTVTRTVTRATGTGITVAVQERNPGVTIERDECLTIALGDGAAYECGDLRLVHELPPTRTMNKARAPALLYNSRYARPGVLLAADVTVPAGTNADSLEATVLITGKPNTVWSFPWNPAWSGGPPRRVVVPINAREIGLATGVYAFTLEVKGLGTSAPPATDTGTVVIVDRWSSPFGAGWWLEGLEQLVTVSTTQKLWIGGDGSTRMYQRQTDTTVWLATPVVERPDTLRRTVTPDGQVWQRKLQNGGYVEFSNTGRHAATVNRQGHRTTFTYTGTEVGEIRLPVPSGSTAIRAYAFNYTGTPALLSTIHAPRVPPAFRITTVTPRAGTRLIEQITDPDGRSVTFQVDDSAMVFGRRNRRNDLVSYAYDEARLVRQSTVDMSRTGEPAIVTTFCAAEGRSLASCASGPQLLDSVYTRLDGPRDVPDTTVFYVTRFGAPREIINALGHRTIIERSDSTRFPMLVTAIVQPNGFRTEAAYNARGLLDLTRVINPLGDGRDTVTRYSWDTKWSFVAKIVPPERDSVLFFYDEATGNRIRQDNARGDSVAFRYGNSCNLLSSTKAELTPQDSLEYDDACNLHKSRTPKGFVTTFVNDDIGRTTIVETPIDTLGTLKATKTTQYDLADRDTMTISSGPSVPYELPNGGQAQTAVEESRVRKTFDEEGNLVRLMRKSIPDVATLDSLLTEWEYDAAHRKTLERYPDVPTDGVERYAYDPAGNVTKLTTRRLYAIDMTYDTLNRLQTRTVPKVTQPQETYIYTFPLYPNDGTSYTIDADVAHFTYDEIGNLKTADNGAARVRRAYFPNGLLEIDTLIIRGYGTADWESHVYVTQHRYDLNGRRRWMQHPQTLAPPPLNGVRRDSVRYAYNDIGKLETLRDLLGNVFSFNYDAEERLEVLGYPGGISERNHYDNDGQVRQRVQTATQFVGQPGGFEVATIHDDTLAYDARGKLLRVGAKADSASHAYTGLGALAFSRFVNRRFRTDFADERYTVDALGNQSYRRHEAPPTETALQSVVDSVFYSYQRGTGRVVKSANAAPNQPNTYVDTTVYDSAGNKRIFASTAQDPSAGLVETRIVYYYDAEDRLHLVDKRACGFQFGQCNPSNELGVERRGAYEEFRYDALGRRVLVRTRTEIGCGPDSPCDNSIKRVVWDGDDVLYEIRYPGGTNVSVAELERDDGFIPGGGFASYGRVAYTHGAGLDRPLSFTRMHFSTLWPDAVAIMPHQDWRGAFDVGSFDDGRERRCTDYSDHTTCVHVEWPGPQRFMYNRSKRRELIGSLSWMGDLITEKRDASGQLYMRNRYYDPESGRFTQEDPIGLAGGLNLYGFADGDPVNYSDPFGLCVPWCTAAVGAAIGGGSAALGTLWYNYAKGNPLRQNLGRNTLIGAGSGAAIGLGVGLLGGGSAVGAVGAGVTVGPGTQKLIASLEAAGPAMGARIEAVARWLPAGQRALMTEVEGGVMLSGGAGARARQIILEEGGRTVVKAFDVTKKVYETIRVIDPPRQ